MKYSLRSLMIVVTATSLLLGGWARLRHLQARADFHAETAKRHRHDAHGAWLRGLGLELSSTRPSAKSEIADAQEIEIKAAMKQRDDELAEIDETFNFRWDPSTSKSMKMAVRSKALQLSADYHETLADRYRHALYRPWTIVSDGPLVTTQQAVNIDAIATKFGESVRKCEALP